MTYINYTYYERVREYQSHGQRLGQAVYNAAAVLYPAFATASVGTLIDPYHNDDVVDAFTDALYVYKEMQETEESEPIELGFFGHDG